MKFYKLENKICVSKYIYNDLDEISIDSAKEADYIYILNRLDPCKSRRSFAVTDPELAFIDNEGISLLDKRNGNKEGLPGWLLNSIENKRVTSINTEYPLWKDVMKYSYPDKWKIHLLGLGDVGGTLITGLRLLGGDCISEIGIYDRKDNKVKRWVYETNQILSTMDDMEHPKVKGIELKELFDCDMFVFCASVGVPKLGEEVEDVRMVQFKGNSELIGKYARMARETDFKGIFAVVSDPVDLLCKSVFLQSNENRDGELDYKGLAPEQIRGYGLGVMHARAVFYADEDKESSHYLKEGRAYGPHGEGLVIANSIVNYNDEISMELTNRVKTANLEVRETGFKPYIAPALSSGALSIIATIKGKWHYSALPLGGVFMGCKNRLVSSGNEIERLDIPIKLMKRINNTYKELEKQL